MTNQEISKIMEQILCHQHDQETIGWQVFKNLKLVGCDAESRSLQLDYTVGRQDLNIQHMLHGGVMGILMDFAMGILVIPFIKGAPPTVELDISYFKPVLPGETLRFDSRILHLGRTLIHTETEARILDRGKLAARGKGIFNGKSWEALLGK